MLLKANNVICQIKDAYKYGRPTYVGKVEAIDKNQFIDCVRKLINGEEDFVFSCTYRIELDCPEYLICYGPKDEFTVIARCLSLDRAAEITYLLNSNEGSNG